MKADEHQLLGLCLQGADKNPRNPNQPVYPFAGDLAHAIGMNNKRMHYILEKWPWWEYGVSARTGWFSDIAAARRAWEHGAPKGGQQ